MTSFSEPRSASTMANEELVQRLRTWGDPQNANLGPSRKLYREAADALASIAAENQELRASILTFRGEVTSEMVQRALDEAGSAWGMHLTAENKRKLMRAALEAANVCESCASAVDFQKARAEQSEQALAEAREALTKIAAPYDGEGDSRLIPLQELGAELRKRQRIASSTLSPGKAKTP